MALPATEPRILDILAFKSPGVSEPSYSTPCCCMNCCACVRDRADTDREYRKETICIYHRNINIDTHTKMIYHECGTTHLLSKMLFSLSHTAMHDLTFRSPSLQNIKLRFCSQTKKYWASLSLSLSPSLFPSLPLFLSIPFILHNTHRLEIVQSIVMRDP